MAQMPDIKPEVNKEPEKKRGAGFLSSLFGGGGGGGSGAAGFGGLGSSAAGSGGLLATKTGLLALVLAGTTVAGGIGVVGYRVFGPGDSDQPSQNIQLFAPRPKDAAPDPNAAAASKDGTSASLDNFARVNSGALKGDTPAASEAAPKDESAASASAAASAAAGASAGSPNAVAGASGNGASTSMLKNTKKLGALSTSFGGGSGSAPSAGGSSKAGEAASLGAMGKGGQLSGGINTMGRGVGTASNARGARAGSRRTGAQTQARFARDMGQQNQYSMRGAGRGFENSSAGAGGEAIGDPNSISMAGAGAGANGAPARSIPKPLSGDTKEVKPPEPPKTYDVTPYSKEMGIAKMLVLLAAGLLYYISTLAKEGVVLKQTVLTATTDLAVAEAELVTAATAAAVPGAGQAALIAAKAKVVAAKAALAAAKEAVVANETMIHNLCIAVGVVSAAVIALGMKIMGGDYGQKGQGQILIVVGGAIAIGAKMAYAGVPTSATMLIAAGAGIAAMMGEMMVPQKHCISTEEGNADKCTKWASIQSSESPSDRALKEYLT